jgi:glycine cleavage system H protein
VTPAKLSSNYEIPDNLLYTKEHEWARFSGGTVRVGITDFAAKTLNDVVYVSLPKVGETVSQFKSFGTVESIKAVSELYSPVSGSVLRLNDGLDTHPELVNKSPYGDGWLLELKPLDYDREKAALLEPKAYASHLEAASKPQHD